MRDVDYTKSAMAGFAGAHGWAALVERIEAAQNQWRLMAHEAHKRRDEMAAWEAGAHIRDLERTMNSLTPPVRPNI